MKKFAFVIVFLITLTPLTSGAAGPIYAGWLPYWQKQDGAMDAGLNLDKFQEISPFSYEVNVDGTLKDKMNIDEGLWPGWLAAARDAHVKIIPTVAWFDGAGIQKLLSNATKRRAHEDIIAKLVTDKKFDGVDIDYESKLADTKPYFSLFIQGLAQRLHAKKKLLSCTIEARMPLADRYAVIPKDTRVANDYVVLNKYCDEVRVMAYDQGTIDLKLDAKKGTGHLYAPVADPAWVEKVIKETVKTISRKKVMLGIPTYRRLRSVNFFTAMNVADRVGATPVRSSAGELSFTYASSTLIEVSDALRSDVSSTAPAELLPAPAVTRYISFTDADAIAQKIALVNKYGLRGAAFFKFDGQADPMLWEKL